DVTHDFLDVTITIGNEDVHFIGGHLKCCTGSTNENRRNLEMQGIINYMDSLGNSPIFFLGDFNSFSPDDKGINNLQTGLGYGPMTMLLDPQDPTYGQFAPVNQTWMDIYRSLNPNKIGASEPDFDSRIDYIMINQYVDENLISSTVGDTASATTGSDHYTVDVTVEFQNITEQKNTLGRLSIYLITNKQIKNISINVKIKIFEKNYFLNYELSSVIILFRIKYSSIGNKN
ncbi:MAG: hypothetical protein ACFFD1_11060, partial [Candidatus Thorarchaeota archaeon]